MEELLQARLDKIFEINRHDRNIQFLKELGLDEINLFTKEIMNIHHKESELSSKNRLLMSRIYFNLYITVQAEKERQEKEIESCPEGGEGEVIKTK
jgi:hypothetical protein